MSPMFEAKLKKLDKESKKLKYCRVDWQKRIARIRMFVHEQSLQHLILVDDQGEEIANLGFYDHNPDGEWKEQEIPNEQEIIGLQCNTQGPFIHLLGFITWTPNKNMIPASKVAEDARY